METACNMAGHHHEKKNCMLRLAPLLIPLSLLSACAPTRVSDENSGF
jgi:hypothetical protein